MHFKSPATGKNVLPKTGRIVFSLSIVLDELPVFQPSLNITLSVKN